ncbi:MAG TPA: DUF5696 domain-containing protein [Capsulimonadaceae bacterium]|jgi:hypothetical protein
MTTLTPSTDLIDLRHGGATLSIASNGALSVVLPGGETWTAPGPLLLLTYYDRQHPRAQEIAIPFVSGDDNSPGSWFGVACETVIEQASPSTATVSAKLPTLEIALTATISLSDDGRGLTVTLDDSAIVEGNPRLYRIMAIDVLPEFGAATTGESGYLTLPNWVGAQTHFDKSYPREVVQTIYSSNDQWEYNCNMGVYGVTRAQGTLCAIVAKGDMDAQLVCRAHWEERAVNSVHPRFIYRWQQQDERLVGVREIRYSFAPAASPSGEGYAFCGTEYRDFLRRERGLLTWDEKAKAHPETVDYLGRFFVKIFMAYKKPQPDGHGEYRVCTTFDEAQGLIEQCIAAGSAKLSVMLVGWNIDGHDGMVPTRFPIDDRLGGEAGLRKLAAWCGENDVMLGVHDYYGGAYTCSPDFDTADLVRHRTGEYWESVVWSGGQLHQICPAVYVEKHVKRYMPELRALGLRGHEHIDAIGSFMPCYSNEHPLSNRADFVAKVREMFDYATEVFGSVSTEMPFGPYFSTVDGFFHSYDRPSRWHLASPIGRHFFDNAVPLLSIVLHGSVNCQSHVTSDRHDLMRMAAFGLSPQGGDLSVRSSKEFGVSDNSDAIETIAEAYKLFYGPAGLVTRIGRAAITSQRTEPSSVIATTYDNGVTVRVNPTDEERDGIAATSFVVSG